MNWIPVWRAISTASLDFGTPVPYPHGAIDRDQRVLQRPLYLVHVQAVPGHHVLIADLDTRQVVVAAKFDTAARIIEGGRRPPARVESIAEST